VRSIAAYMSRSPSAISAALFRRENHSVPVKKLPTRCDGITGMTNGCACAVAASAVAGTLAIPEDR